MKIVGFAPASLILGVIHIYTIEINIISRVIMIGKRNNNNLKMIDR